MLPRWQLSQVPIMIGTTRDEGNFNDGITQYFKPDRAALNEADIAAIATTYGGNAGPGGGPPAYPRHYGHVKAHYPVGKRRADGWDLAHRTCWPAAGNTRRRCRDAVPVYMYLFDDRTRRPIFRNAGLPVAGLSHRRYPLCLHRLSWRAEGCCRSP